MSNFFITQSLNLIRSYNFHEPLQNYLRKEFQSRKQMGARDRRQIREVVYSWFRIGNALKNISDEERLLIAFFLTHNENDILAERVMVDFSMLKDKSLSSTLSEKIECIQSIIPDFKEEEVFPFKEWVSPFLDIKRYTKSIFQQPKVWLRIKPGSRDTVLEELKSLKINFEFNEKFPNAIALEQGVKLETTRSFQNGLFEVQDLSSQLTGEYFQPNPGEWWLDCCAASGGKSLLLRSIEKNINLTVSDSRSLILKNLATRFKRAGISSYKSIVADLEQGIPESLKPASFDGIIADVPCSGSGTWARTPEQIQLFKRASLDFYIQKQRKILSNISSLIKPGKPVIYITCSVFFEENEAAIEFAQRELGFTVEKMNLIQGMDMAADSLFVARLVNSKQ